MKKRREEEIMAVELEKEGVKITDNIFYGIRNGLKAIRREKFEENQKKSLRKENRYPWWKGKKKPIAESEEILTAEKLFQDYFGVTVDELLEEKKE